jgi:hypothetical protein
MIRRREKTLKKIIMRPI